jgi:hypothetical protein
MSGEPELERHSGRWVARRFVTHEVVLAADSVERPSTRRFERMVFATSP